MATKPNNVITRQDLTNYAHGLSQDMAPMRALATSLAPVVPTGASNGRYNKFDDTQMFVQYAKMMARRAIGGQANNIQFLSETANFNAEPYGLRIPIDNFERTQAGEGAGETLLRQAKTRTLLVSCWMAYLNDVITIVKAGVSAEDGKGGWNKATVDPIKEINEQIKAVWLATGVVPNKVVIDFGAWCVLSDNPKVVDRMPGADVAQVNPARIARLLVNPAATIEVIDTATLTGGGLGNSSATKKGVLGGSCLILHNSPTPTQYDPSFAKTFAPSANLFTEVFSYMEEPHLEWYENDWTADVEIVASGLCKRIDVTGANS